LKNPAFLCLYRFIAVGWRNCKAQPENNIPKGNWRKDPFLLHSQASQSSFQEQARRERAELEKLLEENRRKLEEAQRQEALEQQRKEEERYRELEELQRQKEEAMRRKKQQEEEERAKQMILLGKNKSRPKLSFALNSK